MGPLAEARNYGVGFAFADQVHAQQELVRGNLGTKLIFRLGQDASVESRTTLFACLASSPPIHAGVKLSS